MNLIKEIESKAMTEEKRKEAKNDIFAFYIGRPLSYVLTVPFLKLGIKPNTISVLSFIPSIIGFFLISFGNTLNLKLLGWLMFFIWNLLDGVDGNVARYKRIYSKNGSLLDATSGYIAMILSYFAMGIGCYYGKKNGINLNIDKVMYVILGGISAICVIFPRLVMHKRITSMGEDEETRGVKTKSKYGILKIIALNLTSISGFVQVFMLIAIIFNLMEMFTITYFIINLVICIVTLIKLLKIGG